MCRGGDCGSRIKHLVINHVAQLNRVRGELASIAVVRASSCLDVCAHSNVIVVTASARGRDAGADAVWLGGMNDDEATGGVVGVGAVRRPGRHRSTDLPGPAHVQATASRAAVLRTRFLTRPARRRHHRIRQLAAPTRQNTTDTEPASVR